MDIYLTAASSALSRQPLTRNDHALVPGEDAYYAQFAWSPGLPAWVGQLIALARRARASTPQRVTATRHA